MGGDQYEATRRAIQHYRRLREWVTDLKTRRALRELIKTAQAKLADAKEPPDDERRS